jgi:hypothetical protein
MTEQDESRNGPPKEVGPSASQGAEADQNIESKPSKTDSSCCTGRCALVDTICTCDFYRDWIVDWPAPHTEPLSVQLRRRRLASYRCARLESGRRDPISASLW